MQYYTLHTDLIGIQKVKQEYIDSLIETTNPYIVFSARRNNVKIDGYSSGKIVFMGNTLFQEVGKIEELLGIVPYEAIGSDEVGTGDIFGPIVVCSCYTSLSDIKALKMLNVRDSKAMKDKEILELAEKILNEIHPVHSVLVLHNKKYNELAQNGMNMNQMKASMHNAAIHSVHEKIGHDCPMILDQFCEPDLYYSYLSHSENIESNIVFKTKGESYHISVACASIIARYTYLKKIQEYEEKLHVTLPKGASLVAQEKYFELKKEFSSEILNRICKLNFKCLYEENK